MLNPRVSLCSLGLVLLIHLLPRKGAADHLSRDPP